MTIRLITSLLFCVLCIAARADDIYLNSARGFLSLPVDTIDGTILASIDNRSDSPLSYDIPLPTPTDRFAIDIRARNSHAIPDVGYPVYDPAGVKTTVRNPARKLILHCGDTPIIISFRPYALQNILGSTDCVKVDVSIAGRSLASETLKKHFSVEKTNLTLLSRAGHEWTLRYGDDDVLNTLSFLSPDIPPTDSVTLQFDPGVALTLSSLTVRHSDIPTEPVVYDSDYIRDQLLNPRSFLTGLWELYDYDFQTQYLIAPDPLRLAICPLKDSDDLFGAFYISGYQTSPWREGMLKAVISPTAFPDVYDVAWTDAEFRTMTRGIKASTQDFPLLTIFFSPQSSHMRLRKLHDK